MKPFKFKNFFIFLFIFFFISFTYINFPQYSLTFDEKFKEYFFKIRGEIKDSNSVVIIDVDEKSIKELGQWPFSRDYFAQVLVNLTNSGAGIIGLDIIFSEPDRSSPARMAQVLGVEGDFIDNDELLGQIIGSTPTITGYFFTPNRQYSNFVAPTIPANFIIDSNNTDNLIQTKGVVTNVAPIQDNSYSSGFFNAYSSGHGKITKMPLLLSYRDKIYPSLAFELIRIASQTQNVKIKENEFGIEGVELNNISIPTDRNGFFNINFRGAKKTFKYLSFTDVLKGEYDPKDVEGKIILIGTSAITLADLRANVYDLAIPGVEIHANIIDNILTGDFIFKPAYAQTIDILVIFAICVILGMLLTFISAIYVLPVVSVITTSIYYYYYMIFFQDGLILNLFYPIFSIAVITIVAIVINYSNEQKQKKFIKDKFSKKVSPAVVNDLLLDSNDAFKICNKEITIFFSDIRGFTSLSEKLESPEKLIHILNLYMEPMSEEIIKTNGTIDKFIGDAIMAYWNAPQDIKNHAFCAVQSAISQIKRLKELNTELIQEFDIELKIGIGIHTGIATIGEMGSSGRSDYTIIGDNVNLASRIEGLTKYFGAEIIISEPTKDKIDQDKYYLKKLACVEVKGKTKPILLFELVIDEKRIENRELIEQNYKKALELYENENFNLAKEYFKKCKDIDKHKIYDIYLEKCDLYASKDVTFKLAFEMDSK